MTRHTTADLWLSWSCTWYEKISFS